MRNRKAMAKRVARNIIGESESDSALKNVDEAIDNMIASIMVIEENLPGIQPDSVQQRAALDSVKELMDEAVNPYFADVVKAMLAFDK